MNVDIESLGTFQTLAHRGAESASGALSQLTGIETRVEVTNATLMTRDDVVSTFEGQEFAGVQIGLQGELSGQTVLAFDHESTQAIADELVPEAAIEGELTAMARSGVEEIGNIMLGGFLDGWADYFGIEIDFTAPTYVERTGSEILPDGALDGVASSHLLVFESRVQAVERALDVYIYMLPESVHLLDAIRDRQEADAETIPLDKLSVFNEMTKRGAVRTADDITAMTGVDTTVEVSCLSFAPVESIPQQVSDEEFVGLVMEYEGSPSGYLAVLFDEPSARTMVETLLPVETDGDGWGEMERSAMKELGNIMTSGFIDGWANVLETSIHHSPPQFVHDMGSAILDPLAGRLGSTQEYAFVIDTTVQMDNERAGCHIYALPNTNELQTALDDLRVERAEEDRADKELLF